MSERSFLTDEYFVTAGWDQTQQSHTLDIYRRDGEQLRDTPLYSTLYANGPYTLDSVVMTLADYGIMAPTGFFADLRDDQVQNRGDFDVFYDPEEGTASIQAEYGDLPDNDTLDQVRQVEATEPPEYDLTRIKSLVQSVWEWFDRSQQQDRSQGMGM